MFAELRLSNSAYALGHGANNNAQKARHHYSQSYFHIGRFNDENSFYPQKAGEAERLVKAKGHLLNYEVDVLGFEIKKIDNRVLPSYNSYSEAYLAPYHPIENNQLISSLNDQQKSVIAALAFFEDGKKQVKIFYLDKKLILRQEIEIFDQAIKRSRIVHLLKDSENKNQGRCLVGLAGLTTPKNFRHQLATLIQGKLVAKMRNIRTKEDIESAMWNEHALNKNWSFLEFLGHRTENRGLDIAPGSSLEILGRYSIGKLNKKHGFGRGCTAAERLSNKKENACNSSSVDRYLVTSPQIRDSDGLKGNSRWGGTFDQLGLDKNGVMRGLRWINVVTTC